MNNIQTFSIILVGYWNVKIFTPSWIMNEILDLKEKEEKLDIKLNPNFEPSFNYKNVTINPTERICEIKIKEGSVKFDDINLAYSIALNVIKKLPYTPRLAIGYNYGFKKQCDTSKIIVPEFFENFETEEIRFSKQEQNFKLTVIYNCKTELMTYNLHYSNLSFIKEGFAEEHLKYLKSYGEY